MSENKSIDNEKVLAILEEILQWIRLDGMQKARELLITLLRTDVEKTAYENSDGIRTSREIAELIGVSHVTVVNYWKKWARYGIVKEISARGGTRFQRLFSLTDFGIEIPKRKPESDFDLYNQR